jgi:hypothetical protein
MKEHRLSRWVLRATGLTKKEVRAYSDLRAVPRGYERLYVIYGNATNAFNGLNKPIELAGYHEGLALSCLLCAFAGQTHRVGKGGSPIGRPPPLCLKLSAKPNDRKAPIQTEAGHWIGGSFPAA